MTEEIKPDNNKQGEQPQVPQEVELIIKYNPQLGLAVKGPGNGTMYDEPLCFWMLHKAQQFIEGQNIQAQASRLIVPNHKPRIWDRFRRRR